MFLTDPVEVPNISAKVSLLSKVVWPALATLVPLVVTSTFKWLQDHSSNQRSAVLIDRITTLAKQITEVPEVQLSGALHPVTPQSALTAELESALHELNDMQQRANARRFRGLTNTGAKIRAAFLLYRPQGFAAWLLHIAFYAYSILLIFALLAITTDQSSPLIASVSDLFAFIFIFGVLGVPPLILRYYASRIHTRQCTAAQLATNAAAS
ncbi:MAG: hypothetical protein KGN79_02120 [Acidobacteriota bacterium]|nr:hypothetical protein [Acidobacteriota bacterium]